MRFLGAKSRHKPFDRFVCALAVIASTDAMAQRHYVCGDGSRAGGIANGNPVVNGGGMEKTVKWAFADGATMIKVVKGALPLIRSQGIGATRYTISAPSRIDCEIASVHAAVLACIVGMFGFVFASALQHQLVVIEGGN